MNFFYELDGESIPEELLPQIERALAWGAYVCQQELEQALEMYHVIHIDEVQVATVRHIDIQGDDVFITLDCIEEEDL